MNTDQDPTTVTVRRFRREKEFVDQQVRHGGFATVSDSSRTLRCTLRRTQIGSRRGVHLGILVPCVFAISLAACGVPEPRALSASEGRWSTPELVAHGRVLRANGESFLLEVVRCRGEFTVSILSRGARDEDWRSSSAFFQRHQSEALARTLSLSGRRAPAEGSRFAIQLMMEGERSLDWDDSCVPEDEGAALLTSFVRDTLMHWTR